MTLRTLRLMRIELTVSALSQAEDFYAEALGFELVDRHDADPVYAALLGASRIQEAVLRRGEQELALQAFSPQGAAYPADAASCDQCFQHFAMPVIEMTPAYARLAPFGAVPISTAGPQRLPQRSGGATAYKFRDPDGHPLELIRFPNAAPGGIDHSAIVVTDAERSIAFYRDELGLKLGARQLNTGTEQDALDGLRGAVVEVVALQPQHPAPHVELLAYRSPPIRPMGPQRPCDIAATRLVFEVSGLLEPTTSLADGSRAVLRQDPDGHYLVLKQQRNR
jgi:catechol 2,3-dioxygenase-like lactoylglutathione lyase family enzyme